MYFVMKLFLFYQIGCWRINFTYLNNYNFFPTAEVLLNTLLSIAIYMFYHKITFFQPNLLLRNKLTVFEHLFFFTPKHTNDIRVFGQLIFFDSKAPKHELLFLWCSLLWATSYQLLWTFLMSYIVNQLPITTSSVNRDVRWKNLSFDQEKFNSVNNATLLS